MHNFQVYGPNVKLKCKQYDILGKAAMFLSVIHLPFSYTPIQFVVGEKNRSKKKMNCWKRRILFKDGKISSFRFLQFQVEEINQREAGYFEKKKNVRKKGFYWWIVPLLPLAEEWGRCRTINLSHKAQEGNLLLHFSIGSQSKKLSKDPTKSRGRWS